MRRGLTPREIKLHGERRRQELQFQQGCPGMRDADRIKCKWRMGVKADGAPRVAAAMTSVTPEARCCWL
jgi:hypothetical protein